MRALLAPALIAATAGSAHADSEKAASASVGWATFTVPGHTTMTGTGAPAVSPDVGGTVSAMYEHMIGSDLGLRAEAAFGVFYGGQEKDQAATSYAAVADAGVVFRFDVLKYVPYAFGGLGAVKTWGGAIGSDLAPVLAIGGGLDILASRQHSYGFELRLASFGGDITVFTLGIRATTRWGYF